MTVEEVAENWYARLNKLKAIDTSNLSVEKKQQWTRLTSAMITRMARIAPYYIENHLRRQQPKGNKFPVGGIIHS